MLWGIKNVSLKSTDLVPLVYRRGIDMHTLSFKGLFEVSTTKVLTCSISTCIIRIYCNTQKVTEGKPVDFRPTFLIPHSTVRLSLLLLTLGYS